MTMMNERFSLLPLEGGGAKRRRLAPALYWQNRINEFLQSVRFLNDHGIGLWGRSPCDHCIYSMGRGRESTCDFPLPDVSCLVLYVELSPLHITPFSPLSFFLKKPPTDVSLTSVGGFSCRIIWLNQCFLKEVSWNWRILRYFFKEFIKFQKYFLTVWLSYRVSCM